MKPAETESAQIHHFYTWVFFGIKNKGSIGNGGIGLKATGTVGIAVTVFFKNFGGVYCRLINI